MFWHNFLQILFRASFGPDASQMPPKCLPDASQMPLRCLQMLPRCFQMLPRCVQMLPRCFQMFPDASRCLPDASTCLLPDASSDDPSSRCSLQTLLYDASSRCFSHRCTQKYSLGFRARVIPPTPTQNPNILYENLKILYENMK